MQELLQKNELQLTNTRPVNFIALASKDLKIKTEFVSRVTLTDFNSFLKGLSHVWKA